MTRKRKSETLANRKQHAEKVVVGLLGHVDHGKTTLTKALTGKWTDTYKEELVRGISIKLGYADLGIYKCDNTYSTDGKCGGKGKGELIKIVSFLDAPGHESLMATAISASAVIDGALFLIAANEPCPQEQTKEHFMVLEKLGIKNIVIVQTKVDLVSKEKAKQHYQQIKDFVKGTFAENAPIIPISGTHAINIERVIEALVEEIHPREDVNRDGDPLFYVLRSFDINKPGTPIEKLKGGVLGGVVARGSFKEGDKIEISPGLAIDKEMKPIKTEIASIHTYEGKTKEASPGGTVAIGTYLDPTYTKGDKLVGNIVTLEGKAPPILKELKVEFELIKREDIDNPPFKDHEVLLLNVGPSTTAGVITEFKKNHISISLKKPVAAEKGTAVAILRRLGQRWRLGAMGKVA